MARLGAVLAAVPLCLFALPGLADTCPDASRARAEQLLNLAWERVRLGDATSAIEYARGATAICQDPSYRHELGRLYLMAHRQEEALQAFQACVALGASGTLAERCEAEVARIQSRRPFGTLVLISSARDVVARLDGGGESLRVGRPVQVSPGPHRLEVSSPSGKKLVLDVLVEPGKVTNVSTDPEAPLERAEEIVTTVRPGKSAAWNWAGVALGSAAVIAGGVFLTQHFRDLAAREGAVYDQDGRLLKEADTVGPLNLALGCTLAGVGAAAVVTSVVLWPKKGPRVSVVPLEGGGAVAWNMEF